MKSSRDYFLGLSDPLASVEQTLERTIRTLKAAGLWPIGVRGHGPAGDGVQPGHLAALFIAQAGDQPSDALEVFREIGGLQAERSGHLEDGPAASHAPTPGEALSSYLTRLIVLLATLDADIVSMIEETMERQLWTLTLSTRPALAAVSWNGGVQAYRVNFTPRQRVLLRTVAPRRATKMVALPWRAISAAALLHGQDLASRAAVSAKSRSAALPDAPESETPSPSARKGTAKTRKTNALAVDAGRSAPNKNGNNSFLRAPARGTTRRQQPLQDKGCFDDDYQLAVSV